MTARTGTTSSRLSRSIATAPDDSVWELLRALGAAALNPPRQAQAIWDALGVCAPSDAAYTEVFVLAAPPHAAIHLGPEGKLGGEGLDRVAGFHRALGLRPREDVDHVGALLMLLAQLGEAATAADGDRRSSLERATAALVHEHLWSWLPGYLAAVERLGVEAIATWARLVDETVRAASRTQRTAEYLPLAMREAPAGLSATGSLGEALDALVTPVRCGMVLTQRDLYVTASTIGVGFRRGERRFALKAMLEQDAAATLGALAVLARQWAVLHRDPRWRDVDDPIGAWWSERANLTATTIDEILDARTQS